MDKKQEVLNAALDELKLEIARKPLSTERILALTGAIKVLAEINSLSLR